MLYKLHCISNYVCSLEAKYYLLDVLVERLTLHSKKLLEDVSICKVPVISSPEEEQLLLSSSAKVCRLEDSKKLFLLSGESY